MEKLPKFNLDDYKKLLSYLLKRYDFSLIKDYKLVKDKPTFFLRHDVDFHLSDITKISRIELDLGIKSTYFILLTSQYNIFERENLKILKTIVEQGHDIGLHYDLMEYPVEDFEKSIAQLDFEVSILNRILGINVSTIVMHQPHTGVEDIFKFESKYIHPHNEFFQNEVEYISDSCRAWRNENLLNCFSENHPKIVQLNLHPEIWLGNQKNRIDFLNNTLLTNLNLPILKMKDYIYNIWTHHEATFLHDKRELNND